MRKILLHLCPCAVHLFGLSPEQTTLRWDVGATQPTLPFIVYWQTPYSAAEHQARIWCQPLSSPLSWLWHVVRLFGLLRCRMRIAMGWLVLAPWACSGSIGHGTWNRAQCSASAPSPSMSWHTGTCSHPALTWAGYCRSRLEIFNAPLRSKVRTLLWLAFSNASNLQLRNCGHSLFEALSASCKLCLVPSGSFRDVSRMHAFWTVSCDSAGRWPSWCIRKKIRIVCFVSFAWFGNSKLMRVHFLSDIPFHKWCYYLSRSDCNSKPGVRASFIPADP